jgi:SAM-dependent methyltransferase
LAATGQAVDLLAVLEIWERVTGRPFAAEVHEHYAAVGRVSLERCDLCGFGRFTPVAVGTAAFYAAITEDQYYVSEKWEFATALRDLRLAGVRRVLDFGSGGGAFLQHLHRAEPGWSLVGAEPGGPPPNATLPFRILDADIASLRAAAAEGLSFDAVTGFQVLEHVEDPLALIEVLVSLVKPGGLLVLSTPDAAGPISNFPDAITETPPHHVTQWTEAAFRAALPRYGLSVERVRREPLPTYLWADYLPVQWTAIWPSRFLTGGPAPAKAALDGAGITHLFGVPGHTLYVRATKA